MNAISRGILTPRLIAPLHTEKPPVATPLTVRKALWDSGEVRSVADLKGRKVALNSKASAVEYWLHAALATGGLTPNDVDVVEMPFPDASSRWRTACSTASLIGEPYATQGEQTGAIVRLTEDFIDDFQVTAVYFDATFLNAQPAGRRGVPGGVPAGRARPRRRGVPRTGEPGDPGEVHQDPGRDDRRRAGCRTTTRTAASTSRTSRS